MKENAGAKLETSYDTILLAENVEIENDIARGSIWNYLNFRYNFEKFTTRKISNVSLGFEFRNFPMKFQFRRF